MNFRGERMEIGEPQGLVDVYDYLRSLRPAWMDQAACKGKSILFFPPDSENPCRWCGKNIPEQPGHGRPRKSCSRLCTDRYITEKMAAHREQRPMVTPYRSNSGPNWGAEAKRICATCPVQTECLAYAVDNREDYGVWAGTGQRERVRLATSA